MFSQQITVLVPPAVTPPRGAQWAAAAFTWLVQSSPSSPNEHGEPQTPQELLAYARSIESTMPSQAAELRFLATHQADTMA